ncbi:hypothetical protein BC629DRAFT_311219 [Irpex lacteus]|nr:hypothetical protein BC629DRAFT_311219 [Irpex lacteus]
MASPVWAYVTKQSQTMSTLTGMYLSKVFLRAYHSIVQFVGRLVETLARWGTLEARKLARPRKIRHGLSHLRLLKTRSVPYLTGTDRFENDSNKLRNSTAGHMHNQPATNRYRRVLLLVDVQRNRIGTTVASFLDQEPLRDHYVSVCSRPLGDSTHDGRMLPESTAVNAKLYVQSPHIRRGDFKGKYAAHPWAHIDNPHYTRQMAYYLH